MTREEKMTMIKGALKTLAESDKLSPKLKERGVKTLAEAYAKHSESIRG